MNFLRFKHVLNQQYFSTKRFCSKNVLNKVLIANRGEIACRLIACAKKLGIKTVSVYNDADRQSLHTSLSDEAYHIGGLNTQDTYLSIDKLIHTAKQAGVNAIHPGYGFLSQSPEFAESCLKNDIIWVGPSAHAIRTMGIKSFAKDIMIKAKVPVIPGYHGENQEIEFLQKKAEEIGFPVMVKPVRGGGGKGMRVVRDVNDFKSSVESARRESIKSFGDDEMLIEKYIENPRHIEVQVIGDNYGNTVFLFERDCSVQRRHQKIIEEAPAPNVSHEIRTSLGTAAVNAAKAVGYSNAGTVEFVMDQRGNFYFMEMNTRLQVEHPVTEMITKVNLVELQYKIANGEKLPFTQDDLKIHGHSFESRIYAEDPENGFLPCTGIIDKMFVPTQNDYVRVDTGVTDGNEISSHFDPMIAKLITWGSTRDEALQKMRENLNKFHVVGLATNIPFLKNITNDKQFTQADVTTSFIDNNQDLLIPEKRTYATEEIAVGVILLRKINNKTGLFDRFSNLRLNHFHEEEANLVCDNINAISVNCVWSTNDNHQNNVLKLTVDGVTMKCEYVISDNLIHLICVDDVEKKHSFSYYYSNNLNELVVKSKDKFISFKNSQPNYDLNISDSKSKSGDILSPMNGTVVVVNVKVGDKVASGDVVAVIEAMKMEHSLCANSNGIVQEVNLKVKDSVKKDDLVVLIKSE